MAKLWNDRETLRIYALVEVRKSDGKCGIVMTDYSRQPLKIAAGKMLLAQKQPRLTFEVIEFREHIQAAETCQSVESR